MRSTPSLVAAALLVATVATDALGAASVSFYLLVAGVPLAAAAGLGWFARAVDEGPGAPARARSMLYAGLVAALVLGAAAREPELPAGSVPAEATAALGLALALLAVHAVALLVPGRRS